MTVTITPIGHVHGGRATNDDDDWGRVRSEIRLDPAQFSADALLGLDGFSHVEVVFLFDRIAADTIEWKTRHPRGNPDWPRVGIFAQRGSNRPNRLGVTVARVIAVDGHALTIEGLDAMDGTPVIDIKPVMHGFLPRGEVTQPAWADAIMADYWEGPAKAN